MAKTVSLTDANAYFDENVLHSQPWDQADDTVKQKALNNAEIVLYREFRGLYDISNPVNQIPLPAIYEQALWMLRQDDTILKAEMGVTGIGVSGISIQTKGVPVQYIAPEASRIIAEDQSNRGNTSYDGNIGWLVM
ncbi:hypothetical protein H1164_08260 [Thermoactinomyces daqus]|uniref:Uncharacterized protein n=1 Tax=Thermoactinomyces daqus TaxID=1329516 RepID=A0A7W2AIH9_9BACL|nr:hypothetical protein [Thermoactinomyces daqus]MBA4542893.1 hypothetical protein [Thermoactinomyces daqus]